MPSVLTRTFVDGSERLLAVAGVALPMAFGIHLQLSGLLAGGRRLRAARRLLRAGAERLPADAAVLPPGGPRCARHQRRQRGHAGGHRRHPAGHARPPTLRADHRAGCRGSRRPHASGRVAPRRDRRPVASTMSPTHLPGASTLGWPPASVAALVVGDRPRRLPAPFAARVRLSDSRWSTSLRRPRCFVSLVVGCLGVTVAQLLTLQGAVIAVGGHIAWTSCSSRCWGRRRRAPRYRCPAGSDRSRQRSSAACTALGLTREAAAAAVAVYRTAGHWLPVLAGMLSIRQLRQAELV